MANWKGTAVPNSGTVEKVYFNNNLSVDETKNILIDFLTNNLQPDEEGQYSYNFLLSPEWDRMIAANYLQSDDIVMIVAIIDGESKFVYSSKTISEDDITLEQGWHYSELEINKEVIPIHEDGSGEIGQLNDKLSSLLSITPFTQSEDKNILMHPKNEDGTANKDVNLYPRTKVGNLLASNGSKFTMPNVVYKQGGWQGEVVPNSGTVEKVYFNTNLSVEEVVSILESITEWETDSEGTNAYFVFRSENEDYITVASMNGQYAIQSMVNGSDHLDFIYPEVEGLGVGWIDGVRNPLDINIQAISSYGTENDKLSSIFSITPFEESSGGLFETNEDGTPNTDKPIQTGISEERVNELIDLKITGWLGGES